MTYQEKQNIVNIVSGVLIAAIFGWIVYQRHLEGRFDLTEDFQKWGIIMLVFMGVSIAARIIIYIIFHIINAIATREEDIPVRDERDKLVEMKSVRNSYRVFSICFMLAIISLAIGMPLYGLLIAFVVSGLVAEIVENVSQIIYYRKGV